MLSTIQPESLPTPLAIVAGRLIVAGPNDGAHTFLMASYLAEASIKLLAIALHTGLSAKAPDQGYRMAHDLIRADGLGIWESWIRQVTSQPLAGFLPTAFAEVVAWASKVRTKPEDAWFRDTRASLQTCFDLLEIESGFPDRKPTVRDLIAALVQLRNKTKAHGAVGADFFEAANDSYIAAVSAIISSCPIFGWRWLHLLVRPNGRNRGVDLRGSTPHHARDSEVAGLTVNSPGVHCWPQETAGPYPCAELLLTNRECSTFYVPNGGLEDQMAWFIDYGTGRTKHVEVARLARPPAPLPQSETAGLIALDIQSNVFGNLPAVPNRYVGRPKLEGELERRLRDKNHPIITLHGRGGIGKTSLALRVAHRLAEEEEPLFDYIVWFSARDIDLRDRGPADVRPDVVNLEAVSKVCGTLLDCEPTVESFAKVLQSPIERSGKGVLFIFDNFETMEDIRALHEFLDTYTCLPNKVLITSREREFKADFPIEVVGMERSEAFELMTALARDLAVDAIVTSEVMDNVYEYSEGHPYVIRVIMGEIAKEGRYVPAKSLLPRRLDIVNAVFERSFNKLTEAGRRVFLTVASWKSLVSELALIVVLGERDIDIETGIDECLRLSLIERRYFLDDQPAYIAPQVARVFGRKKLEGDPDRLIIQEDLSILQRFGVVPAAHHVQVPQREVIVRFVDWCVAMATGVEADERERLERILGSLAELWPEAWLGLARFRVQSGADDIEAEQALRRAVEEQPHNRGALLEYAALARRRGNEASFVASRLKAVELDPLDITLIRDVAFDVCKYVSEHASEIPLARRNVYLASIREKLKNLSGDLDATGLSRLAWLYLLEDNREEGWRYASAGLRKEADNRHCRNIIERLKGDGYQGK